MRARRAQGLREAASDLATASAVGDSPAVFAAYIPSMIEVDETVFLAVTNVCRPNTSRPMDITLGTARLAEGSTTEGTVVLVYRDESGRESKSRRVARWSPGKGWGIAPSEFWRRVGFSTPPFAVVADLTDGGQCAGARRAPDGANCPPGFPVKGNLAYRGGEPIYHLPGWTYYAATRPFLCLAEEWMAQALFFRASQVR